MTKPSIYPFTLAETLEAILTVIQNFFNATKIYGALKAPYFQGTCEHSSLPLTFHGMESAFLSM